MKKPGVCELCSEEASLYCASDAAYLCWTCDARVHQANFLVARHVRRPLCSLCRRFDGRLFSGAGIRPIPGLCSRCSPKIGDSCKSSLSASSSLSCSSDCVSSTESVPVAEKAGLRTLSRAGTCRIARSSLRYRRAEGMLVIWARRLCLRSRRCLSLALRAFGVCVGENTVLPLEARLASSIWLAAKACEPRGVSTWQLTRLEESSGVPRKLILLGVSRLARAMKVKETAREGEEAEEGWAESLDD